MASKRLVLTYHQEASMVKEIQTIGGPYKQGEELRRRIRIQLNDLNALVQGQDFEINDIGEITFLHR